MAVISLILDSTSWVLGTKLRSSDLAVGAFTEPSQWLPQGSSGGGGSKGLSRAMIVNPVALTPWGRVERPFHWSRILDILYSRYLHCNS